ncbi:MAG: RNA methyltransferase [Cypionkella sp.]|nr:RNA methyltransferase [Cypionkella sp.]
MTLKGFAGIGLFNPKDHANVGGTLRAASIYGAGFVAIEGIRGKALKHAADTTAAYKHMPAFLVDDILSFRPHDCQLVVVDLIKGAVPLPDFTHPERAMYLFGPEDGTLGKRHTDNAQHVVFIPASPCMNLAATVNVVLYDRMVKRGEWEND